MAESVEGAGFCLPSEFFDYFLMDKENFDNTNAAVSNSKFCFPTEFPYDFETDSDERLEAMSTSPRSTLAHVGSWTSRSAGGSSNESLNGVPLPPKMPLVTAADGEAAETGV
ncbi:hypothetical protein Salat_1466100 [Sesamum alatum]|uniref:Uncharacterized protein n=1 Tax=Sesamum alatum TaxID=300844 RepID=A0AAE1YCB0_9LAMI|nr:hypothetical protein Salat_1466100 [Sesamum alatum]